MVIHTYEKKIVIVGLFATGKTTLVNKLLNEQQVMQDHKYVVYHTDDFLQYDRKLQMRFLLNKINLDKPDRYIIEGAAAYRLLISGVKENNFYPDLVIQCLASDGTRQERYMQPERLNGQRHALDKKGMKDFKAFDNMYRKMWNEYMSMPKKREPRIIHYITEEGYNN